MKDHTTASCTEVLARDLGNEQETEALGKTLAQVLAPQDVVGLRGDLGAGKTCVARGILDGLFARYKQIRPEDLRVTSPTYTLMNLYPGPAPFAEILHADLYRLTDLDDLESTGYWDQLEEASLLLAEWIDCVQGAWPREGWDIELQHTPEDTRRALITWRGSAQTGTERLRALGRAIKDAANQEAS